MEEKNSRILQAQESDKLVTVVVSKAPIAKPIIEQVEAGASVREIFNTFTGLSDQHTKAYLNGQECLDWDTSTSPSDHLAIVQVPQGIEMIVVATILATVAVAAVGYHLFKPDTPDNIPAGEKIDRVRGSKNTNRAYDPIPVVLGKRRITPNLAAEPIQEYRGNRQYYKMLLNVGYGPLDISDIRIGEAPLSSFARTRVGILDWYNNSNTSVISNVWSASLVQVSVDQNLPRNTQTGTNRKLDFITSTLPAGRGDVRLTVSWVGGLYGMKSSGGKRERGDGINFQYRDPSTGRWLQICRVANYSGYQIPGIISRNPDNGRYYISTGRYMDAGHKSRQLLPYGVVVKEDASRRWVVIDPTRMPDYDSYISGGVGAGRIVHSQWYWINNNNEFIKDVTFPEHLIPSQQVEVRVAGSVFLNVQEESWSGRGAWDKRLLNVTRDAITGTIQSDIGNPTGNYRPVIIAIEIEASEQLSGNIDNVNCLAESVYPSDWNADWSNWNNLSLTRAYSKNPAAAYKWQLQGPQNPAHIPNSKIKMADIIAWRNNCSSAGWEISEYMNYTSPLKESLNNIARTGRAEFSMEDGQFSVVENIERKIPTQIFTPKNSRDFSSKRSFPPPYEGVSFEFQNEEEDYELDEGKLVDPDGVRNSQFRKLEFWGVTKPSLVQRHAMFALLEEKLRRETYQLTTDIEVLACKRGDLVKVANDVIDVGIGQGFIQSVSGTQFSIDETKDLVAGNTYGIQVRSVSNGTVFRVFSATYQGDGNWQTSSSSNLNNVKRGDLVVYGEAGREVLDCIISNIRYNNDFEATVTMVNAANDIYSVTSLFDYPPYETGVTTRPENVKPKTPIVRATGGISLNNSPNISVQVTSPQQQLGIVQYYSVQYYVESVLDEEDRKAFLENPENDPADFGVRPVEDEDIEWVAAGVTQASSGKLNIMIPPLSGETYRIRAKAHGVGNLTSDWSEVVKLTISSDPVADVKDFSIKETLDLPKTPNGMWNTITIEVIEPEDPNYIYSIVEYRAGSDQEFQVISKVGWEFPKKASTYVLANGQTYEIRVRSVNIWGQPNRNGLTKQYKTTNTLDPKYQDADPFDILPVPNVRGLELFEKGNETEFEGRDAKFTWRRSTVGDWVEIGAEGLRGASASRLDQYFRDYQVEVWANNKRVRVEETTDNFYTYFYEKNAEDYEKFEGQAGAYREFQVRVVQRGRNNQVSAKPAVLDVSNPAPEPLLGIELIPGFRTITVRYNRPTDLDYQGVEVWVGTETGFDVNDDTLVYDGPDTEVVIGGLETGTQYYIILRPYDAFGKVDIFSTEFTITTLKINTTDLDNTKPDTVTNVAATTDVYDSRLQSTSYIDVTWDAVTNTRIANYTIDINGESQYTVAGTSFRFTDAIPGEDYTFKVRANSFAAIEGDFSTPVTISAAVSSVAPAVITNASVSGGLEKVIIEWTNPDSENFYSVGIYRGTTAGFTPSELNKIASVVGSSGSVQRSIDTDVVNDTTYYYKLIPETLGGVQGSVVNAGSATPNRITPVNIDSYLEDAAIVTDKIANEAIDLSGNKITGQLQGINLADAAVDSNKLADLSITAAKIVDGTIDLSGNKITGQLQGVNLADAAVDSDKLADLSVEASKIANGSVGTGKLADLSITAGKIADGTIDLSGNKITGQLQGVNLADAAVDSDKLADLSVEASKIANGAVTDSKVDVWLSGKSGTSFPTSPVDGQFFRRTDLDITYRYNAATSDWYAVDFLEAETRVGSAVIGSAAIIDAAISSAKIEDAAITSAKIEDLAVGTAAIANAAVTNAKIQNLAVDTAKIQDAAITSAKIEDLAVGTAAIADAAITSAKIEELAVGTAAIANGAITNAKIQNLAVDTAKIEDAAITSAKIQELAVGTAAIANAAITNAKIQNLAVTTGKIQNAAITNAKIGNAAVDTAQIKDAAIATAKIQNAAIISAKIGDAEVKTANIADLSVTNAKISTLDATKITTGTLDADRIGADTITSEKIDVGTLDAITANMGTLTAGKISVGNTTTGLELDTLNGISAWNTGVQTLHFKPDGTGYIGASQDISWDGSGNVSVSGDLSAGSIFTGGVIESINNGVAVTLGPKDFSGNLVPSPYAMFESAAPTSGEQRLTTSIDNTFSKFGGSSLKAVATGQDAFFRLAPTTARNVIITPNQRWILSAYVAYDPAGSPRSTNNIQAFVNTTEGGFLLLGAGSVPVDGEFHRVWFEVDLTNDSSDRLHIRFDVEGYDGQDVTCWFDGVQFERNVTGYPSAFTNSGSNAQGVYLLSGTNSVGDLVFGVDENGNATFDGKVTITGGSQGIANFSDAGSLATKSSVDNSDVTFNYAGSSSKGGNASDVDNVAGVSASVVKSNAENGATFTSTDAGGLAYKSTADWSTDIVGTGKPQDNATYGADWTSTLSNIPNRIKDNATLGLNLTDAYLGYYDGTAFRSYIQSNGKFHFGSSANNFIDYNGSKLAISTDNFTVDPQGNATFSGSLDAASGTFAGELQAASGTFAGELQAATGVFGNKGSGKYVEYKNGELILGKNTILVPDSVTRVITVGASGQFTQISDAIEYVTRTANGVSSGAIPVEIRVIDDTPQNPVHIMGAQLGWIRIRCTAADGYIKATGSAAAFFRASKGAHFPIVDANITVLPSANYSEATISATSASTVYIEPGRIITTSGTAVPITACIRANISSTVVARQCVLVDSTSSTACVISQSGSNISAEGASIRSRSALGAYVVGSTLIVRQGEFINISPFDSIGTIQCLQGGFVDASYITVTYSGGTPYRRVILTETGSNVTMIQSTIIAKPSTSTEGTIRATTGATAVVEGSTFSMIPGSPADMNTLRGGTIVATQISGNYTIDGTPNQLTSNGVIYA